MKDGKYTYEEFLEIIRMLRGEGGCPWDREQTHQSLKPCMTEEAAEVVAAIRIFGQTGDCENLVEELGDVMLQVVMHAQIGSEEKLFDMEDVIDGVARKMVRRHPHVFGEVKVDGSAQVLDNWEDIKKKEKEGRASAESPLREIPAELPALTRACKVLKRADRLYEPQPDYAEAVRLLREAADGLEELKPADYDPQITRLVGDALLAISQISRICRLSQEQILADRTEGLIDGWEPRINIHKKP